MPIFVGTLARYFGLRFLTAVLLVFAGIFALVTLVDYIELMRRAGDIPNVSAVLVAKTSFYRVPQVVERILPFCILIGAMSCYLGLSRRLELVVARSAGLSAWQFVTPALVVAFVLGLMATAIY
ncbi:MAG: LptF/LptG family permease, partial [Pseudolabrys sp.]